MVPPAPVTFSTTTCWPSAFDIGTAIRRATVSDGPPAWNGATMVMNREGNSCALALDTEATSAAARHSDDLSTMDLPLLPSRSLHSARIHTSSTCTWHVGFLFQIEL